MTKMFYLTRIGPCGAATGLDIGLGNTSLKFITLTFYSKNSSPPPAKAILSPPRGSERASTLTDLLPSNVQVILTCIRSHFRLHV